MDFSTILGQMLMLLLMMILGYLARRQNLLDEHVNASLSKVVLNVTLPAQIITSFAMEGAELTNGEVGAAFGLSCLIYLFYMALAVIYVRLMRLPRQDWGTYQYMIIWQYWFYGLSGDYRHFRRKSSGLCRDYEYRVQFAGFLLRH